MCRFKELSSQQGRSLPDSSILQDKELLSGASNDKAKFHIEKLKSFAFKMLLSALCNDFHEIVPEVEINQMDAVHIELVVFMKKVMHILPKVSSQKKKATASTSHLPEQERVYDSVVRKAKMFDLFGFLSFNKEFRSRIFSDDIFAIPVALMLEYFTDVRSKFKEQFLKIFDEFRQDCLSEGKQYPSYEEILKIESLYFENLTKKQEEESAESISGISLPFTEEDKKTWAETRVLEFASKYNLKQELHGQLRDSVRAQDLTGVFFLLVSNLGTPLKVPVLKKCFDLYLMLLRLKHAPELPQAKEMDKNANVFDLAYDKGFEPKGKRTAQDDLLEVMEEKVTFDELFGEINGDDLFNFVHEAEEPHHVISETLDTMMASTAASHEIPLSSTPYELPSRIVRNHDISSAIFDGTFDDYDMFSQAKFTEPREFDGRSHYEPLNPTSSYECNLDFDFQIPVTERECSTSPRVADRKFRPRFGKSCTYPERQVSSLP